MATLESIRFVPHRCKIVDEQIKWESVLNGRVISGLPYIFWAGADPWTEANHWLLERATSTDVSIRTVCANATALHAFAEWLEQSKTNWWDFPARKAERCLVRYRGFLVKSRDEGRLAPSTVQQRMNVVINFYRWLLATGLLSTHWPLWREHTLGIRLQDSAGFERTISVNTTDLSIRNRVAPGEKLEDGLLPLLAKDRDALLDFAKDNTSQELFLMLSLGFFTGMRIGTITDLKVRTLSNAVPDPSASGLLRIAVGPAADPPVATKFSITGFLWITSAQLEVLLQYAHSAHRLKREAKAKPEHRDLVFLTRFGNPYAQRGSDKSSAVNVEMFALRKLAIAHGITAMRHFRFHQSRCTYATELARIALKIGTAVNAVALVKEALLHKNESSSLRYIRFIEKTPAKIQMANQFTLAFLGLLYGRENPDA
jgi:integrase